MDPFHRASSSYFLSRPSLNQIVLPTSESWCTSSGRKVVCQSACQHFAACGTDLPQVGHEAVAGVVMTYNTDNRGRFFFELRIDTSVRPGGDVDDEPADDEEAA